VRSLFTGEDFMLRIRSLLLLLLAPACSGPRDEPLAVSPQAALDSLLAVDRAFARAAADTNAVTALAAMFSPDVYLRAPGDQLIEGKDRVIETLRTNPANLQAHLTWAPVRGGISADGQHGFTYGYMEARLPDSTVTPFKYLAYWVRGAEGWRVRAYRRAPRARAGGAAMMPPALPPRMVPITTDSATVRGYALELDRAERAFSDEAQRIGVGRAFVLYGSPDAMNFGGPGDTNLVISAAAIGGVIGFDDSTTGASLSWAPDHVVVASSGDLGVTIGFIDQNASTARPRRIPFFTVWRRGSPAEPWKYVAE
jgi:hypothetical protein